jgi:hypothetical protein
LIEEIGASNGSFVNDSRLSSLANPSSEMIKNDLEVLGDEVGGGFVFFNWLRKGQ